MTTTLTRHDTQQQFEQLFQRSRRRAYRLAYHLTGNVADAEDVTQDAYIRAWSHFDRYDTSRSFEGWLFRIITNRFIDLRRRNRRLQAHLVDTSLTTTDGQLHTADLVAPDSDPQEMLLTNLLHQEIKAAIAALPDTYRQAITLCDVEQRSYLEVAGTMDCALGTVRSRVHRARTMLRRNWHAARDEDGGARQTRSASRRI